MDALTKMAPAPSSVTRFCAMLGDLTFPLYLIHFPLLVLARASKVYDPASSVQKALLVLALLVLAHALTKLTDPFKLRLRNLMHQSFQPKTGLNVN